MKKTLSTWSFIVTIIASVAGCAGFTDSEPTSAVSSAATGRRGGDDRSDDNCSANDVTENRHGCGTDSGSGSGASEPGDDNGGVTETETETEHEHGGGHH